MKLMVFCPGCGSSNVEESGGDNKPYPHPTAQDIIERFIMILCKNCKWSWNTAGAKQEG